MRWALLLLLGACGESTDGPEPLKPCDPTDGYPPQIATKALAYTEDRPLELDGQGARCDQLIRALGKVPELAVFEGAELEGTCQLDPPTGRDIVRMNPVTYGGQPLIKATAVNALRRPDVLAHVQGRTMVYLAGTAWVPGTAPAEGCLAAPDILRSIPDRPMTYQRFTGCTPQGPASYEIAPTDEIMNSDTGLFLDVNGLLHWGSAIDVFLKKSHVTPELINSDAYCCTPGELDHCVGHRLLIDTHTGELVIQEPHCRTC